MYLYLSDNLIKAISLDKASCYWEKVDKIEVCGP